jgi:hypothetical protein
MDRLTADDRLTDMLELTVTVRNFNNPPTTISFCQDNVPGTESKFVINVSMTTILQYPVPNRKHKPVTIVSTTTTA